MTMLNVTDTINDNRTDNMTTSRSNNISESGGCRILRFNGFVPWDNPDNIVSAEFESFVEQLKGAIILPLLFLIGGPTSVINMAVFYRQGLRERINLCLFALSLVDGLYLVHCMFTNGDRMYLQFASPNERNGPVLKFMLNHNLIGFVGLTWVSRVISVIIACERCLCVVSPLRSQAILTTRTMAIILIVVFVLVGGVYFLVATRFRSVCVYDPVTGTRFTMIDGGPFYYKHKEFINYLDFVVYGMGIPGIAIPLVTVTTIVTHVKLRQAIAWRSETSGALSPREVALTKMLIANSVFFLCCMTPIAVFRFVLLLIPDMKPGHRHHNLFFTTLWLLELPSFINSSFNIFIYYSMGSKYRETFKALLCSWRGKVKGKSDEKQPIHEVTPVT